MSSFAAKNHMHQTKLTLGRHHINLPSIIIIITIFSRGIQTGENRIGQNGCAEQIKSQSLAKEMLNWARNIVTSRTAWCCPNLRRKYDLCNSYLNSTAYCWAEFNNWGDFLETTGGNLDLQTT